MPRASKPGQKLRDLRENLGLTMRDVSAASARIAKQEKNIGFRIPISRLHAIEQGVVPSIYRITSLARVYKRGLRELLGWYGCR